LVSKIFNSDMHRPSGAYAWQMPIPSVDPIPPDLLLERFAVPEDAQDASYFAASARMASFSDI
jgi:hypothetical protein